LLYQKSIKAFVFLVLCILSTSLQTQQWQLVGLENRVIYAIAIDPLHPDTLYAGANKLYRSTDAGLNWKILYQNRISDIAIHPENSDIIYAVSGVIVKTTDGGYNWNPAMSGINLNVEEFLFSIEMDPISPDTLYSGSGGVFGGHLFKTINSGNYWFQIGDTVPQLQASISEIAINPFDPLVVFVGTDGTGWVMKTTDGGITWNATGLALGIVEDVKIDYQYPIIDYAGGWSDGFFKSEDGGNTWQAFNSGLPGGVHITGIEIDYHSQQLYLAAYYDVYRSSIDPIYWELLNDGLPSDFRTTVFALDSVNSLLYLGTNKGLYKLDILTNLPGTQSFQEPHQFALHQNYPNPFNSSTLIGFTLSAPAQVAIEIFTNMGQRVYAEYARDLSAGYHVFSWDGRSSAGQSVASGVYYYKISQGRQTAVHKMVLLR